MERISNKPQIEQNGNGLTDNLSETFGCPLLRGKATCHPCAGGWPGTQKPGEHFVQIAKQGRLKPDRMPCGTLQNQARFLQTKYNQQLETSVNKQPTIDPQIAGYLEENHFSFDRWTDATVRRHFVCSDFGAIGGIVHIYAETFPQFGPLLLSTKKGLLDNIGKKALEKLNLPKEEALDKLKFRQFHFPSKENLELLEGAISSLNHPPAFENNGKNLSQDLGIKVPLAVLKNTHFDAAYFVASNALVLTNGRPTLVQTPHDQQIHVEIATLPELLKRNLLNTN